MTGRRARATRARIRGARARRRRPTPISAVPSPSPRRRGPKPEDRRRTTRTTRASPARGDTPEILELDEDGEEVGGEAKGKGRARGGDATRAKPKRKTKARRRRRRRRRRKRRRRRRARRVSRVPRALRLGGRAARVPETGGRHVRTARAPRRRGRARVRGLDKRGARAHARAGGGGTTPTRERRRRRRGGGGDRPERRRRAAARGGGGSGGRDAPGRLRPRAARGDRGARGGERREDDARRDVSFSVFERERTRTLLPTCRTSGLSIVKDVVFERLSHRNRNRKALFLGLVVSALLTCRSWVRRRTCSTRSGCRATPAGSAGSEMRQNGSESRGARIRKRLSVAKGRVKRALPSETNASIVGRNALKRLERVIYG